MGLRTRFAESSLLGVLEALVAVPEAYVAIESASSFREATKLAELAAQLAAELENE